jgi:hypothetical protein
MISRCTDHRNPQYKDYGGRGIQICTEWLTDFDAYAIWCASNGFDQKLFVDREDNDGPYSPDNCRFVTRRANNLNRRNTRFLTAYGETKTLLEWSEDTRCLVSYSLLKQRVFQFGWNAEEAMSTKYRRDRQSAECSKGHQMTEENTYRRSKDNYRVCKTCSKAAAKAAYYNQKQPA